MTRLKRLKKTLKKALWGLAPTPNQSLERPSVSSILKPKTNAIFHTSKKLKREKKCQ